MRKIYTLLGFVAFGLLPAAAQGIGGGEAKKGLPESPTIYEEHFDNEDAAKNFTIVDSNDDNDTWAWRSSDNGHRGVMACYFSSSNASNDWLITPEISVEAGKVYQLQFTAWAGGTDYTETMGVWYGEGTATSSYKSLLTDRFAFTRNSATPSVTIKPEKTGKIHLAFHATSAANQFAIYLDDIVVKETSSSAAPQGVMLLSATAATDGSHQATVRFNAPLQDNSNQTLASLSKIEIYRDSVLINTIESPAPGSSQSYTDLGAHVGTNRYDVYPYNEAGIGIGQTQSVYVGSDIPGSVSDVKVTDTGSGSNITWKAPTKGANNHYLDPNGIRYKIYKYEDYEYTYLKTVRETSTDIDVTGENQSMAQYAVSAINDAGEGAKTLSDKTLVGQAYNLPIIQDFNSFYGKWTYLDDSYTDGDNHLWWRVDADSWTHFSPGNDGAIMWQTGNYNDKAYFNTGKIDFSHTTKPVITFDYYTPSTSGIQLEALKADQSVLQLDYVDSETTGSKNGSNGWKTRTVDLASLKGLSNVVIRFHGEAANSGDYVGIDNVSIIDQVEHNLYANITAPATGYAAKESKAQVFVTNLGSEPAEGYSVKFYANDELVDTKTATAALAANATDTLEFAFTPQVGVDTVKVYAVVDYADDQNLTDNTSKTLTVAVEQPNTTTVNDLTATAAATGNTLKWTAITPESEEITDDFESYPAFTLPGDGHYLEYEYNIGPWYNYDEDQEYSLDLPGYAFPWEEEAFAFITFNRDSLTTTEEGTASGSSLGIFEAHSGNQFLAAFSMKNDMAIGNHVSDWLISPQLTGDAQKISFWFKTLNKNNGTCSFQVAYSTTDSLHTSFDKVLADSVTASSEWEKVEIDLPAGAKYFAIHHVSPINVNQMLMIDDVTYTKGIGEVLGYKVYRDGKYVATVSQPEYTDAETGDHNYNVTVLYNSGESGLSNTASTSTTGINSVKFSDDNLKPQPVYNIAGQRVGSSYKGIVIQNGKKYIRK